jgi:hypothetical protein
MGRDSWRARQHDIEREERRRVHPAWRGVGCLMMSVLAIGGYVFSNWFLVNNAAYGWVYLPPEILRPSIEAVPSGVRWMVAPLFGPGVLVSLAVGFLFLVFSYLFVSIVYAIVFPAKPGEFDVPALKRQKRRKV